MDYIHPDPHICVYIVHTYVHTHTHIHADIHTYIHSHTTHTRIGLPGWNCHVLQCANSCTVSWRITHTYTHVCVHSTHTYTQTHTYIRSHTTHTHIGLPECNCHVLQCANSYRVSWRITHTYTHTHTHIHTHTHTYTHRHMHTYIHMIWPSCC